MVKQPIDESNEPIVTGGTSELTDRLFHNAKYSRRGSITEKMPCFDNRARKTV